jgi:hypothetical protein
LALDGLDAKIEFENNREVFVQFRRPLMYYNDRPNEVRKYDLKLFPFYSFSLIDRPLCGEILLPEESLKRKASDMPEIERNKSPKHAKMSSPVQPKLVRRNSDSKKVESIKVSPKPKISPKKHSTRSPSKLANEKSAYGSYFYCLFFSFFSSFSFNFSSISTRTYFKGNTVYH